MISESLIRDASSSPPETHHFLSRLKLETLDAHDAVEAAIHITRPDFSLEDYRALLESFLGFYSPFEAKLLSLPALREIGFDYTPRLKSRLLVEDLVHLGDPDVDDLEMASDEDLPSLDSVPAALGAIYVVEGSTLGGQVIVPLLGRRLSLTPDHARFFSSYGPNVRPLWHLFLETMEKHLTSREDQARAIDSANETFRAMTKWVLRRKATA